MSNHINRFFSNSIFSKINPEHISVIPLAANIKQLNSKSDKSVHNLYWIPNNYLLSVGTFEPRKNLARLIESFLELKHSKKLQDVGLVLVGGKGWLDSGVGSDKEDLNKKGIFITTTVGKDKLLKDFKSIKSIKNNWYEK